MEKIVSGLAQHAALLVKRSLSQRETDSIIAMTTLPIEPAECANVNAMLLSAWRRFGPAVLIDDATEPVTGNILARRVMAMSYFIDEGARGGRGPVAVFLPRGGLGTAAFLGALATGRGAIPFDVYRSAHLEPASLEAPDPGPSLSALLASLPEAPSLCVTLRPLEAGWRAAVEGTVMSATPILFADEIAEQMDEAHQERIRERLSEAWLDKFASIGEETAALYAARGGDPKAPEAIEPLTLSHGRIMNAVARLIADMGGASPRRFLSMVRFGSPASWLGAYLPSLALGARLTFIRIFYPAHVQQALCDDHVEFLLMNPEQYEALLPFVEGESGLRNVQFWTDREPTRGLARQWREATGVDLRDWSWLYL